jgi:hypothetical protein
MHALIDGDIFLYAFGSAKKPDGSPIQWPFLISRMDGQLSNILRSVDATSHQIYLTGEGNFREKVATILPYKGNRPKDKPYWHQHVKKFLIQHRGALLVEGMEADDAMGIEQMRDRKSDTWRTVICSLDKDLDMIPGWHYNWKKDEQYWIDELTAERNFWKQMLTGDSTDNILGLYGVGKSSSLLKQIDEMDNGEDMQALVEEQYKKRFGNKWHEFFHEFSQLLWILRSEDEIPTKKSAS